MANRLNGELAFPEPLGEGYFRLPISGWASLQDEYGPSQRAAHKAAVDARDEGGARVSSTLFAYLLDRLIKPSRNNAELVSTADFRLVAKIFALSARTSDGAPAKIDLDTCGVSHVDAVIAAVNILSLFVNGEVLIGPAAEAAEEAESPQADPSASP